MAANSKSMEKKAVRSAPASPKRVLIFKRALDAPRKLVWQAWTDSTPLAQWWGPRGFTNPVCELDVRAGGAIRVDMRGPDGAVYPIVKEYGAIEGGKQTLDRLAEHVAKP